MGVAPFPVWKARAALAFVRLAAWPRAFDALENTLQQEAERWVLWLPVALGAGIALYFALPFEPSSRLALPFLLSGLLVAVVAFAGESVPARLGLGLVAAFAIGFATAKLRADRVAAPVLFHRTGPVMIEGVVDSTQLHGKGVRLVLTTRQIGHMRTERMPARVRVSVRSGAENLKPGDVISVRAVLMPPPSPASPGDYDFGRAAYFLRIGAVGFSFGKPAVIAHHAPDWSGRAVTHIEFLRWRMTRHIHNVLPGSTGGIAAALITGDRGAISTDDESALRDAGLAHVLAIAGLHMALVGLGLFWAVRAVLALFPFIALVWPIKKWAAVAALCGATFYLIISGAAVPATRAYVMLMTMLLAILFDRPALSMRSVAMAAAIVLLLRPESIIEPGFQMSFAAVVSLVAVAEWERSRPYREGQFWPLPGVRRYMRGIAITSFVGSVATAPFAAFHFDRATHYAVLGNLLAMPIMGFLTMPAAAVAVLTMPFGLDRIPLIVMGAGIEAMLMVGRWVSGLPGAVSITAAWPVGAIVLMSLGGLWIAIWRARWRWLGVLPLAAGVAAIFMAQQPDLLIARDGMTVAIRGTDGALRLLRKPADKFSAAEWLKRDGDDRDYITAIATPRDGVRCDSYGCIARAGNGMLIAASTRAMALAEDCANADIVVSASPVRGLCAAPKLVVDRFDVARNGAYAVWFGKPLRIRNVREARGGRPWNVWPRRRSGAQ
ncbi:MAG: ComEC family competence protein [Proteobacteria bacterium]|nr:ComEC family competence protein [Pseudomonadota bacterium]